ncbi:MAG: oligosaccharide flippase family protein [Coriobacteriia bacterium]|nr:oligosaccharide flippase family protein [Coriobacteriia bacterium]
MPSEKRRFVVNTALTGLSQFAAMLSSIVFMPFLIDAFGIGTYGLFMLASSITAYAALLDLGVGSALTKMVAQYAAEDDSAAMSGAVSSALSFYCVAGLVVALGMLLVGMATGLIFNVDERGAILLRNMLWLGAAFQLWYWPASTARYVLAGFQRYDILAKTGLLATVFSIGAIGVVLVTGRGPVLLVGLLGLATTAVSLVNIGVARRLAVGVPVSVSRASRSHLRAIFVFSWAVFVIQLSDVLFYQQTDRVILGVFASAAAVGLYEAAAKFNALVTYVSGLTVSAVLPLASSMEAQGRHASLRSLFMRGTKYIAALVAPVSLILMLLAEPIVRAWLGAGFVGQGLVAAVLLLPHALVCLGLMGDAIVISKGRIAARIPYVIAQTVLNVALSAVLVVKFGVIGVAIGTAVAHLVDFPFHMRFLLKEARIPLRDWLREVVAPVYPQLVVPLGIGFGLRTSGIVSTLPGVGALALVMLGAYWTTVYATGLSPAEREEIRNLASSAVARLRGGSSA